MKTKSQTALRTDPEKGRPRYYIGGKRVARETYSETVRLSTRQDTFQTIRRGNAWLHYSVIYS